jgi:predicted phosphohydrolase
MPRKRLIWLTDVHFNFVDVDRVGLLMGHINQQRPDAVLLGGDIAESHDILDWLMFIDDRLEAPLYFVLGNHDYYHGSIVGVREAVGELCSKRSKLIYLTEEQVCPLTPQTALIGHDGWSDARAGDYDTSTIVLNDYLLIEELRGLTREARREILARLGDEAAAHVRIQLREALKNHSHVVLLTHSPPLRDACWYQGHTADDNWAPHFTCAAMGQMILETMPEFPNRKLTVLCGHTHNTGVTRPLDNVEIITGEAEYGDPQIVRTFEVE